MPIQRSSRPGTLVAFLASRFNAPAASSTHQLARMCEFMGDRRNIPFRIPPLVSGHAPLVARTYIVHCALASIARLASPRTTMRTTPLPLRENLRRGRGRSGQSADMARHRRHFALPSSFSRHIGPSLSSLRRSSPSSAEPLQRFACNSTVSVAISVLRSPLFIRGLATPDSDASAIRRPFWGERVSVRVCGSGHHHQSVPPAQPHHCGDLGRLLRSNISVGELA